MEQINRAISILKSPQIELARVKSEQISANDIIRQYIAILAAIPAVAYIIGMGIVGVSIGFGFGSFKYPIESAIVGGILTYILSIAGVYITGVVINSLAPNFSSRQSEVQAMKLAAYSATPGLLGGIFYILPALSVVSLLLALYGLYILYLGIPVLMETPNDKALNYTVVIIVVSLVIYYAIGAVTSGVMMSMSPVPAGIGYYRP